MASHVNNIAEALNQTFTVLSPDGQITTVDLAFVTDFQFQTVAASTCMGVQVGAAGLLFLSLFLITKADKRRSLVFMLNALALLLVVARGVFLCTIYTGPFYNWYRYETHYYAHTGVDEAISLCAQLCNFLLIAVLEFALVIQVRIVCCTLDPQWRFTVNAFNIFVALLEVGLCFAFTVLVISWNILGVDTETAQQFSQLAKLAQASNILLVASIGTSASIFCAKLGFAIRARRSMGMTQFGPMQIIFIMGCQTMCIPRKSIAGSSEQTDNTDHDRSHLPLDCIFRLFKSCDAEFRAHHCCLLSSAFRNVGSSQHDSRSYRRAGPSPSPCHSRWPIGSRKWKELWSME